MRLSTCMVAIAITSVLALPAAPPAAALPWCHTDSLSVETGPPISPGQQPYLHFGLIFTNISQQTCTMQGYPGVDLVGPDDPPFGTTFSLPRSNDDVQPVVLTPGAQAESLIGFLPKWDPNGDEPAWKPTTIIVTPPDSTTALQTGWLPYDFSLLRGGDGTRPGAIIRPLHPYS
ncbi:DUF4232 domain-containing protein [Mycolicibacterium sp. Dal123E01]|uniref:DUF4232 domain-containing protein n=1 Tax=Mycolicibacterium sp. Dal123E01 TaxID=3457578 RepID=UPI00403E68B9